MRAALWLLALFAVAVAIALFAGNNPGTVTLYWPPWRVDLSLNLVLLLLGGVFVVLYAALRGIAALFEMPRQASRWRMQQRERAMHGALLDAISHLLAGRFIRARKSAESALEQERALAVAGHPRSHGAQLRAVAHVLAAESAHALQDKPAREEHIRRALKQGHARDAREAHEGALMQAARWALDDHDPDAAIGWLHELPQGAARRTRALRIKLKAARLAQQTAAALETARLLSKHGAFSGDASKSLVRGLATDLLNSAHDVAQLQRTWASLEPAERAMPELAIHAAQRLMALGGDAAQARDWLQPAWERQHELGDALKVKLVRSLEAGLDSLDPVWLARIESAQRASPRDALLQYLAGMACMKRQLWGKAQQLMSQAAMGVQDPRLHRSAWRAVAELAEQRGDEAAAAQAWKRAATD